MTKKNEFDLIVIGGGPGGYVAAIRASQLGLRVMCVEKRSTPGGTCLNVGCIPSKTLLHSSHLYEHSKNNLDDFGINIDEKNIVSSTGALSFDKVPKKLAVIGGGYIGLEMGSVWSRLGSEVTVIEYLDYITPGMDREISNEFQKILSKQGIKFKMGSKVENVQDQGNSVSISYTNVKSSKKETLDVDKVLVSVGRKPYTEGLNLSKIGIKKDNKGRIEVNQKLQTSVNNIYAWERSYSRTCSYYNIFTFYIGSFIICFVNNDVIF